MGPFTNPAPAPYEVGDQPLLCEICKNDEFWHRRAQLQGAIASFFDLEWLGPTADCFVCSNCGYIHWFLPVNYKPVNDGKRMA